MIFKNWNGKAIVEIARNSLFFVAIVLSVGGLSSCGGGSEGTNAGNIGGRSPQIYSTTLTNVSMTRISDLQEIPANDLPVSGAEITKQ